METLTYSSNELSVLNDARRSLWSAKYMLGCANQEPDKYDKSLWMGVINTRRAELRKVARELRAKLPARKMYRVPMQGEASEFVIFERAHSIGQAVQQAESNYPSFTAAQPREL